MLAALFVAAGISVTPALAQQARPASTSSYAELVSAQNKCLAVGATGIPSVQTCTGQPSQQFPEGNPSSGNPYNSLTSRAAPNRAVTILHHQVVTVSRHSWLAHLKIQVYHNNPNYFVFWRGSRCIVGRNGQLMGWQHHGKYGVWHIVFVFPKRTDATLTAYHTTAANSSRTIVKVEYATADGRCLTVESTGMVDLKPCRHLRTQLFWAPSDDVLYGTTHPQFLGLHNGRPWMLPAPNDTTDLTIKTKEVNGTWQDTFTYPTGQHIVAGRGTCLYVSHTWPGRGKAVFTER